MSRGGGLQGSTYCPNRIYELERVCVRQVPDDVESEISELKNRADAMPMAGAGAGGAGRRVNGNGLKLGRC